MNHSKEAEIYLKHTQRFLGKRTNVTSALEQAKENPEIVEQALAGLDFAILALNSFIATPEEVTDSQGIFIPFSLSVKDSLKEGNYFPGEYRPKALPTSTELAQKEIEDFYKFRFFWTDVDSKMHQAERSPRTREWSFHKDISDSQVLADALAIELYSQFISQTLSPFFNRRETMVLALEEMLTVHGQDLRMFRSVSPWFTVEEGFSPLLVKMLQGQVDLPFIPDRIVRLTPNFLVFDGFKPGMEGKAEGQRWYIEPISDQGERMLNKAAKLHGIDKNLTPALDILSLHTIRPALRADRISENLRPLLGGLVEIPAEGQDSIPSPSRMEECLRLHPSFYSFSD